MSTCNFSDAPLWLQFNKYVRTGYRHSMLPSRALLSLFEWHNETINVWSHLIPFLGIIYLLCAEPLVPTWTFSLCLLSFVVVFGASVAYHLFMPCCSSSSGYLKLVNCDVLASLLGITTTALSFLNFGHRCLGQSAFLFFAALLLCSSLVVAYVVCCSRMTVVGRVKLFGVHCMLRLTIQVLVLWPKVVSQGFEKSFYYHTLSFLLLGLGGIINGSRWPEKKVPTCRLLDFALNSHNVWHYLCIILTASSIFGCYYDFVEHESSSCY